MASIPIASSKDRSKPASPCPPSGRNAAAPAWLIAKAKKRPANRYPHAVSYTLPAKYNVLQKGFGETTNYIKTVPCLRLRRTTATTQMIPRRTTRPLPAVTRMNLTRPASASTYSSMFSILHDLRGKEAHERRSGYEHGLMLLVRNIKLKTLATHVCLQSVAEHHVHQMCGHQQVKH